MSSIDQLVGYEQVKRRNTLRLETLPDWISQGFPFPLHPQYKVLLDAYQQAKAQHVEAVGVVQFAVQRRVENPDVQHSKESLEECRKEEERTRKALSKAERELQNFVDHSPAERIALYEAEVAQLEISLLEAHAEEQKFIEELLSDPNAQRSRLDRIVHGYTGMEAEYTPQQITQLRSLRGNIEETQAAIIGARRNIEDIRRLTLEQQRREEARAAIEPVLTQFNECCNSLLESLKQLDAISSRHGFRLIKPNDLHIPTSAVFDQAHNLIRIHGK